MDNYLPMPFGNPTTSQEPSNTKVAHNLNFRVYQTRTREGHCLGWLSSSSSYLAWLWNNCWIPTRSSVQPEMTVLTSPISSTNSRNHLPMLRVHQPPVRLTPSNGPTRSNQQPATSPTARQQPQQQWQSRHSPSPPRQPKQMNDQPLDMNSTLGHKQVLQDCHGAPFDSSSHYTGADCAFFCIPPAWNDSPGPSWLPRSNIPSRFLPHCSSTAMSLPPALCLLFEVVRYPNGLHACGLFLTCRFQIPSVK